MESYFAPEELRCKCGRLECDALTAVEPMLLNHLNYLRARIKRPIMVTSALRCVFWNRRNGGEADSEHLIGCAADLSVADNRERWELVTNIISPTTLFNRVWIGDTFVHVDIARRHDLFAMGTYYRRKVDVG